MLLRCAHYNQPYTPSTQPKNWEGTATNKQARREVEAATIQAAFTNSIPRGWAIQELVIEAQENYGTSIEPDIRSRFSATVRLEQDLYSVASQLGGAVILRPTARAGDTRVFYGISRSVREGAGWRTTFELDNNPTAGVGEIASAYSGQVLIEGSQEESAFRAALDNQARLEHEEALRATQRAEEERAEARKAELAEAAHMVALEEATRQAEREAQVAGEAHEIEMRAQQRAQAEAERVSREAELSAQLEPLPDQVREQVRIEIPVFWQLGAGTLGEAVVTGSFDAPVAEYRFELPVTLRENLYIDGGDLGGVPLLTLVEEQSATRQVRGLATAKLAGGRWHIELELDPLDGLHSGFPRDQYVAHAVVIGSPAEAALRDRLAAAQVERTRELEALEAALISGNVTTREAAIAQALSSSHDAVVGVGLRHALADMNSIVMELALFPEGEGIDKNMDRLNRARSTGITLIEVDLATGGFTGHIESALLQGIHNANAVSGTVAGGHLTFTTTGGNMAGTFTLITADRLEGIFQFRNDPPLSAVIHIR